MSNVHNIIGSFAHKHHIDDKKYKSLKIMFS